MLRCDAKILPLTHTSMWEILNYAGKTKNLTTPSGVTFTQFSAASVVLCAFSSECSSEHRKIELQCSSLCSVLCEY
jgi:hypothetical protein